MKLLAYRTATVPSTGYRYATTERVEIDAASIERWGLRRQSGDSRAFLLAAVRGHEGFVVVVVNEQTEDVQRELRRVRRRLPARPSRDREYWIEIEREGDTEMKQTKKAKSPKSSLKATETKKGKRTMPRVASPADQVEAVEAGDRAPEARAEATEPVAADLGAESAEIAGDEEAAQAVESSTDPAAPPADWDGGVLCALGPTGRIVDARPVAGEPAAPPPDPAPVSATTYAAIDKAMSAAGAQLEAQDTTPALLGDLGFERTGEVVQEVRPAVLRCAAETWRDAKTERDRAEAADVLARAGWFRRPGAEPPPALPVPQPAAAPAERADNPDLGALRAEVVDAKAALEAAEAEAKKVEEQARAAVAKAKERYRAALAPYRDACKVQGRDCEFEGGGRGANVSERVSFEVEIHGENVRIALKGKPETEEKIPLETVRASPNKIAGTYTERHVGPKEVVGNKQGTLSNKLRAVLAGTAK